MVHLLPRVTVDSCFVVVGSGLVLSLVVAAGLKGFLGYLLWVFLVCGGGFLLKLWIFVFTGCFGHDFRSVLLLWWFYRPENKFLCWVNVLHVLPQIDIYS